MIKIEIALVNDTSGKLDSYITAVSDEDAITEAVLNAIQRQRWVLCGGDSIKITTDD